MLVKEFSYEAKLLSNKISLALDSALAYSNAIIAGGAITSVFTRKEINDLDLYFRSWDDVGKFLYAIENTTVRVLSYTDKAILLTDDGEQVVQVVYFDVFPEIEDIFNKFDFTVVMGAFDYVSGNFYLHDDFLHHNSQRILKYNPNTSFPIMSALRVDKYNKKGYSISKSEFLRVVLSVKDLNISSWKEIKSQIGGMYGLNIDNVVKEDGEFEVSKVIDQLANVSEMADFKFDVDNFNHDHVYIDNYVEFVYKITKSKVNVFPFNGNYYCVTNGKTLSKSDLENEMYKLVECPVDTSKIYKHVKKVDDGYYSYWDGKFEYIIGEEVVAKGSYNPQLYFYFTPGLNNAQYKDKEDAVVIECEYNVEDVIQKPYDPTGIITVKKCKVFREVPEDEVNKMNVLSPYFYNSDMPF